MSNHDDLLADIAEKVESEQSNQMPLTVVVPGAVITGRLAPEAVWRERVAEVLRDSEQLKPFAELFAATGADARRGEGGRPTHLHLHVARILQGSYGLPDTGGMYRVPIDQVCGWTLGELSYSDA
ncbi:hypothetical protein CUT44_01010 [Streptomyces carminius]|uniref:Uncharacterized protein n=1 Tax=Streptomyces carminius TaxID=2665496 RepID=A0A2M8M0Z9_9ACTN|nr:hypothetical protein [Streptomyces carminius]PJE97882.1 hypothetical protein CUT44_09265 [Streptomyces carminius]PJF01709.1 hypothetical protein CUT44_01010 [Streptomyces carminius]